jgi:hypothetical protein
MAVPANPGQGRTRRHDCWLRLPRPTGALHVATIHHRVPEVTQVTNRRHPGRQLTTQPIGDDRVRLFVAEPGDAIQRTHLAVRDKMNMGVDEPWENRRVRILGYLPGFVELSVPGLDADDLSPIEKYGRWSLAELFAGEHPRAPDGHHQLVILLAPSPVKAGLGLVDHMAEVLRGHVVTNAPSDEHNDRGIAGVSEQLRHPRR